MNYASTAPRPSADPIRLRPQDPTRRVPAASAADVALVSPRASARWVEATRQMPAVGDTDLQCQQADKLFNVKLSVRPTPNPSFRRVDAQVLDGAAPILRIATVVGRF